MFDLKAALRDGSMIGWSAEEYFDVIMKASLEIERLQGHKDEADRHIATIAQLRHELTTSSESVAQLWAENKRLQQIIFNLTGADG